MNCSILGTALWAQDASGVEGLLLSEDKLYVVLAVVLIVWLGLVFFLFRTDRKLDRLERRFEEGILLESEKSPGPSDAPPPSDS